MYKIFQDKFIGTRWLGDSDWNFCFQLRKTNFLIEILFGNVCLRVFGALWMFRFCYESRPLELGRLPRHQGLVRGSPDCYAHKEVVTSCTHREILLNQTAIQSDFGCIWYLSVCRLCFGCDFCYKLWLDSRPSLQKFVVLEMPVCVSLKDFYLKFFMYLINNRYLWYVELVNA